jgi:hypothetical protein
MGGGRGACALDWPANHARSPSLPHGRHTPVIDPQTPRSHPTHPPAVVPTDPHPPLQLANRLFSVEIEAADGTVPVWHEDVRFFCVKKGGKPKAYFYLDPYSRPAEKRGGAWCVRGWGEGHRCAHVCCVCCVGVSAFSTRLAVCR